MTVELSEQARSGDQESDDPTGGSRSGLRIVLVCVIVVALVSAAAAGGWLVGHRGSTTAVADNSVDAGFVRDMSTHHQQAVTMANYERDFSTNPTLQLLAYDIEDAQTFEIGQMQGWLDSWGLARGTARPTMAWMAGHGHLLSNGLMPGMASPAQMDQLETLKGTALDIDFLQLMIHHHQGGLPMAQYAAQHAEEPYVRNLANSMIIAQSGEIVEMEQLLRQLGASPLPAPTS